MSQSLFISCCSVSYLLAFVSSCILILSLRIFRLFFLQSLFLAEVCCRSCGAKWLGKVVNADHTVHLISQSVYDVKPWFSAIVLKEIQLMHGKWKKEQAPLSEEKMELWKFLLNLCGDQQILWDSSDSSYKNTAK